MNSNKIRILFIPAFKFHSRVSHAGGQILNYYFSHFYNDDAFEVAFGYCTKTNDNDYNITCTEYSRAKDFSIIYPAFALHAYSFASKLHRIGLSNAKMLVSSFDYKNAIIKILKKANRIWHPDIVVLDWTQTNIWAYIVKKYLPDVKIIAVEHDISFQAIYRLFPNDPYIYRSVLKNEIAALNHAHKVLVFNEKDKRLLLPYLGIDKIEKIMPFYRKYKTFPEDFEKRRGVLFFGAMQRHENVEAVENFLDNIFPFLKFKNEIIFYCVGGGAPEKLIKKYSSQKAIFTGFVEDPSEFFQRSFCLVVPLLHGAGIKIKVIEGMASGLPVVTNNIGIEGIDCQSGEHYIHCNSAEDFIAAIDYLYEHREICKLYAKNAISLVENKFSLEKSYEKYKQIVIGILKESR